jgi:carbonic anhydrase
MTSHRKDKPVVDRSSDSRQDSFNRELMGESRLRELREKHVSGRLSSSESLELILQGNSGHVDALKGAPMTAHQRYLKIIAGQADYLIVRCSDARVHKTDSEQDTMVGIHIYIAGNVIPGKKTASFDEIAQVASLVRSDGACLDEAHCDCGAVKERVKWVEGGMKPTGSESLDCLLHEVIGPTPSDNAVAQLSKLRNLPGLGERATGALYYDWQKGGITIVDANQSPVVELLVGLFNKRHADADSDGHLAERLAKQKPHAIIIGSNLLPFSLNTITHASQNEVFQTTGSGNGLDEFDEGSILYAVEHLGVRHIPFIAPGISENSEMVAAVFDQWEMDLRQMTVNGKTIVANMLDSGELTISRLRYDLSSGRLVPMGAAKPVDDSA